MTMLIKYVLWMRIDPCECDVFLNTTGQCYYSLYTFYKRTEFAKIVLIDVEDQNVL